MIHSIYDPESETTLSIESDMYEKFTAINLHCKVTDNTITHFLDKKQLHDFIGTLLHVQAKTRK